MIYNVRTRAFSGNHLVEISSDQMIESIFRDVDFQFFAPIFLIPDDIESRRVWYVITNELERMSRLHIEGKSVLMQLSKVIISIRTIE